MSEQFNITDRRHGARSRSGSSGLILGQSVSQAKTAAAGGDVGRALDLGRQGVVPTDQVQARQMRMSRMQRAAASGVGGSDLTFATQRPQDPFFYWQQNNLPYDFSRPDDLIRLRALCRHIYRAHSLMASAIDIYSQWPVIGMEIECKDSKIREFHEGLFFDQLDYEEFLPDVLREYWVVGEAFPLGSFNETLGVWEADELINPDDVFVQQSPFVREPNFFMKLPESLRTILRTQQPPEQYQALMRSYPELKAYASDNAKMPVSNMLMQHLKFKTDSFSNRGLPIMYRALRPLMQEEMLNAAQDAIADRLYTPLILARIGASATDLGTEEPWIPSVDQINTFEASLDAALAADFRVLTTHFAVQMDSVFGRETMPNFDMDFERLAEKQLQAFGLSKTMISGAGSGQTYAADAMNRDLVSQLLSRAQRYIKRLFRQRAEIVAEAQGHFDYEVRGGKRYPIMEEVLEVDEETGEQRIVEQPKLLIPELRLKTMSMKDEEVERGFLEALRASGVPISQRRRLVNVDIDLDEEKERTADEQVEQALEAQRVRKQTYMKLKAEGLPIPQDLRDDFDPKPLLGEDPMGAAPASRLPMLGLDGQDTFALAPDQMAQQMPPGVPLGVPAGPGGTVDMGQPAPGAPSNVIPLPTNYMLGENPTRPSESDEMRARMPKPAALLDENREAMYGTDPDGNPVPLMATPGGIVTGPRHVGMRRYAGLDKDTPLGDADGAPLREEDGSQTG